jgi:DNA adenine methylase
VIEVVTHRQSSPSQLRYPAGKASHADLFETAINALGLARPTYVEPYAGGAGAALELLYRGAVGRVVINDLDRSIYACWYSMVNRTEEFLRRLESTPLTVDEWLKQREIYRQRRVVDLDLQDLGFATFYLNRTNRSGVLNGGIIGGFKQAGNYRLDARFNRETLKARIERLAEYRTRISVTHQDGVIRLRHWLPKVNVFTYVDPPYYAKGGFLYFNSFRDEQHQGLADVLNGYAGANWVLTYDTAGPIKAMYAQRASHNYNLHYSAHRRKEASELMVISDPVASALQPNVG